MLTRTLKVLHSFRKSLMMFNRNWLLSWGSSRKKFRSPSCTCVALHGPVTQMDSLTTRASKSQRRTLKLRRVEEWSDWTKKFNWFLRVSQWMHPLMTNYHNECLWLKETPTKPALWSKTIQLWKRIARNRTQITCPRTCSSLCETQSRHRTTLTTGSPRETLSSWVELSFRSKILLFLWKILKLAILSQMMKTKSLRPLI